MQGFRLAKGEYVACMDADLQHPPEILPDMVTAMCAQADMEIPSRFIPGGSDGGLDLYRKTVSAVARYLGKLLLPCLRHISDPTGGIFMVRRELLRNADLRPVGWKIMVEVLAMCPVNTVIETPYAFREREHGATKLSLKVTVQYLRQLVDLTHRAVNRGRGMKVERWTPERLAMAKTSEHRPA